MPESFTRRNLPHWYMPGAAHFVTCRLAGTLPASVLDELRATKDDWLKQRPRNGESRATQRYRVQKQLFARYDAYLDQSFEIDWLRRPEVAEIVRSSLYHLHGQQGRLMAYCLMPNHLHFLWQWEETVNPDGVGQARRLPYEVETPDQYSPLATLMHSLKSYSAHEANRVLGRSGSFWQHESYDHWVRDEEELERIVEYIAANPVKAGLAKQAHEWRWSSAYDRFQQDGALTAWLCPT
jgi:putative DNA methylase